MSRQAWMVEEVSNKDLWGELYIPNEAGSAPRPALIIMPSSAGVCEVRERFYAQTFARLGCICFIADVFARRGLTQCMTDQSLLDDSEMLEDARTAFRWLATRDDVRQIGILGVSKGGSAALNAALLDSGAQTSEKYALHVCIAPSCAVQPRHPRVTGAPLLLLLGGRDDYTGVTPALHYAARILAENQVFLETVVFPEAHHAWELRGEVRFYPQAECYRDCLFYKEEDGSFTNAATGETFAAAHFRQRQRDSARLGAHAGGGTEELCRATCETIRDFMRRTGFLSEAEHVS